MRLGRSFAALILVASTPFIGFGGEKVVTVATLSGNPPLTFDKENAAKKATETIPPGADSERLQGYSWDVLRREFPCYGVYH